MLIEQLIAFKKVRTDNLKFSCYPKFMYEFICEFIYMNSLHMNSYMKWSYDSQSSIHRYEFIDMNSLLKIDKNSLITIVIS